MEEAPVCVSRRVTVAHEPPRTAEEILRSAFELLLRESVCESRGASRVQSPSQQERSKPRFLQEVSR